MARRMNAQERKAWSIARDADRLVLDECGERLPHESPESCVAGLNRALARNWNILQAQRAAEEEVWADALAQAIQKIADVIASQKPS